MRRIAHINSETNEFLDWDGSDIFERALYSEITRRIEKELLKLEKQAHDYNALVKN